MMPEEVIATVHQLDKACKKYKGIIFTDKDGNIKEMQKNMNRWNIMMIMTMTMKYP